MHSISNNNFINLIIVKHFLTPKLHDLVENMLFIIT